jgi:hypothetical protein
MENYFNYFTEIEEHFWKKRGTALLVSTLDWALIDTWKQAQIPLETVLKGIDDAFQKHEKRRRGTRKVNSLAYCHQAVLDAAETAERAKLPHPSSGEAIPRSDIARFLTRNADAVEKAAGDLRNQERAESAATLQGLASSLREIAATAEGTVPLDLEEMERRLTVLEDRMLSVIENATPEAELIALRGELERSLGPARRGLGADQIAHLQKQFLARKLLEAADLPRLSLFYL